MAIRCNSPPESWPISRSSRWAMPNPSVNSLYKPRSSTFFRRSPTLPFTRCGKRSTFCGLTATEIRPSLTSMRKSRSSPRGKVAITASQSASPFQSPRLGINLPDKAFTAVDFPMPLGPKMPTTLSLLGVGRRNSRNPFSEYRCIMSVSNSSGRLMIFTASSGHNFARTMHGGQACSEILTSLPSTMMHSLEHI